MSWVAVLGGIAFAFLFFASIVWVSLYGAWDSIARDHFPAVVGLPSAALAALFIVLVLRTVAGPIEMKIVGFEFKGASGPIVMWIACFLSIAMAIRWLWAIETRI
ncbi:hypothetical protein WL28_11680 [Burkholderia ubonensis]|nr:hypothetical protein WJ83_18335 [Burkholderia ubonensis]KVP34921.1 hypothetical protein WJ87_15490 [Burkholderia ubonensis]KWA71764.1 hypothetical protein WL28_11680 [Burkholderia ubonensis]